MLVLASTSGHRKALLQRLGLPFEAVAPEVDEAPRPGEEPHELAARLAQAKAEAVAARYPGRIVIGSDQVAIRDGAMLGKPGTEAEARRQLETSSGHPLEFLTAVCILDGRSGDGEPYLHMDITRVQFRPLSQAEIDRYLEREQPLDAAGSFYSEGLGISLVERIDSLDPTGLIGLPLIWVAGMLRELGLEAP
jgi:septum formation protein